ARAPHPQGSEVPVGRGAGLSRLYPPWHAPVARDDQPRSRAAGPRRPGPRLARTDDRTHGVRYDAVIFDLLTALIDSWSLWNAVAGSPDDGMKWRRRYLEITYACGAYRPYETLVREAARDVGLPERLGEELEERWDELAPWPEALAV